MEAVFSAFIGGRGGSVVTNSRQELQAMFTSLEKTDLSLILVASLWCITELAAQCL